MKKVGTITTAVCLLALGVVLILGRIYPGIEWLANPLKWWPVLLIGLGLEIIVRRIIIGEKDMKIDPLLVIFLIGIFLTSMYGLVRSEIMSSGVLGWKYHLNQEYKDTVSLEGIKGIDIEVQDGEVDLLPSTDGKMQVAAEMSLDTNDKTMLPDSVFTASRVGDRLVLKVNEDGWPSRIGKYSMKTSVYLPPSIPVYIESQGDLEAAGISNPLTIEKHEGNIEVADLKAPLDIRSDYSDIKLQRIQGNVQIVNDGPVVVGDMSSDIRVVAKEGDVSLKEVYGNIDASTNTGAVSLNNARGIARNCRLKTEEGSIDLAVGKLDNCRFAANAESLSLPTYLNPAPVSAESEKDGEGNQSVSVLLAPGSKTVDLVSSLGSITVR